MSKLESKSLYNLLKNNDLLPKSVQETLNRLSFVQYHLTELLPGDLQIHCRAINLQGDRLTRYHTPSDDLDQPLDFDAAARHCGVIAALAHAVAESDREPRWRAGVRYRYERLLSQTRAR